MTGFVREDSIVRKIWGTSDVILFIFAGASAEFALNKAVDWLYFTGKLPKDPIGRLFSTVSYARRIVFSPETEAIKAIGTINQIHLAVEKRRGEEIPEWAYRDVLFMLIFYSITAYELLERKLSWEEKEEVYEVFYRVGAGMNLKALPATYKEWLPMREKHLLEDLTKSNLSRDLYKQYRKHLGPARFKLLIEAQKLLVPPRVRVLLNFDTRDWLKYAIPLYKVSRRRNLDKHIRNLILPSKYKSQIDALDMYSQK